MFGKEWLDRNPQRGVKKTGEERPVLHQVKKTDTSESLFKGIDTKGSRQALDEFETNRLRRLESVAQIIEIVTAVNKFLKFPDDSKLEVTVEKAKTENGGIVVFVKVKVASRPELEIVLPLAMDELAEAQTVFPSRYSDEAVMGLISRLASG